MKSVTGCSTCPFRRDELVVAASAEEYAKEFDDAFVHFFEKKHANGIIQKGDVALCGVVATSTRNANLKERQMPRCPICASLLA